jgi:multiple antibiotic resistance protein
MRIAETFLLVLAALFPVINPPGAALVFLSMTKYASVERRRALARRVAINAFFVMAGSLLVGALILRMYGISIPVLRVAGGLIVAAAGWKLLNEGAQKDEPSPDERRNVDYQGQTFYPLTLPLTTGPGTIAVMISLGLSQSSYSAYTIIQFIAISIVASIAIAATIYGCFAFSDRIERLLGRGGTEIAVRLSAFILFCLGIQIIWTGAADLLGSVITPACVSG